MLTVLHVLPPEPFGGAQRLVIDLARVQAQAGLAVEIWYTNASTRAQEIAFAAGVAVASSENGAGGLWQRMRALGSALRKRDFDIVHLHLPPPWVACILPRKRSFGLVTHLHLPPLERSAGSPRHWIGAMLAPAILSRSDLLISISQWIEDMWRAAFPDLTTPFRKVFNGTNIPAEAVSEQEADRPVIGMATRLAPEKGVEEFIDLAASIHSLAPHVGFRLAGDGPMRTEYERLASARGLAAAISFCGFVQDTAAFWRSVHVAAFTPPTEPFGLRLIEPVAHGLPVIAYRNGSGSDEVIDRCRGIVATEYGQVGELARIAVALMRSQPERERLAAAGIADLRRFFSLKEMEAGIREVYREALGPARLGGVGGRLG